MTKNIFKVSDEEAKRIRVLHESESENKKIDSSLITEQAQCGGQGQTPGKAVHWQGCPGTPNLLNPFPCAMVDNQTPHSGMIGWKINVGGGHMGFCATITSISNFGGNLTSSTPTPLERSNSCTDCDTPYNTGTGGGITYNCNNGNCIGIPGNSGTYATMNDCQQNCQPPIPWLCDGNYNCIQSPNGQYATQAACQADCNEPAYSYDCNTTMGQCYQVAGGGGQYADLATCNQNCEYDGKWSCRKYDTHHDDGRHTPDLPMELGESNHFNPMPTSGHHCVKDPNGQYNSQQACQANCPPRAPEGEHCINCEEGIMNTLSALGYKECPDGWVLVANLQQGPCYECDGNGNCNGPSWAMGPNVYNSQLECQNGTPTKPACTGGPDEYECVNGQCVIQANGQYTGPTALADCQANCGQPSLWECDTNNGCSQTANGTYQSQTQCETACCQDVINNWNWAQGSQQNPCQKFYNMFGPMGVINPNNLPFNQECQYNYLLNLILNLGGPCVQGNFITLLNGFSTGNNGCYGNPASGCQNATSPGCPHQNSICGKRDQFCNASPMTPSKYFKCQYAISFANSTGCIC